MPPKKRPPAGTALAARRRQLPTTYVEGFLHYLRAECGMADNTTSAYRSDLRRFTEWYADHGPPSFTDIELKMFVRWLEHLQNAGLAASSIARHVVSVRMFFRYLMLEGVVAESAADLLASPRLWHYLPRVLSPEQVDQLLAAPVAAVDRYPLRDRAILAVMYATGCRASEVTGLQLRHVRLQEGSCRCLGKGNRERIVSLNPVAIGAIEAWLREERPQLVRPETDAGWLFLSRGGRALSRIDLWNLVKKYATRTGCGSNVSPHTLRHSFATHMLARGAEIRALQEMLGHASIATTQIYTQVEHSRLKAVHRKCHPRG